MNDATDELLLGRIIRISIIKRRSRIAIAIIAGIVGASIAGALLTVSMNIRVKVGNEFRQHGANILIVPKSESVSISIGEVDYGSVSEQRYIEEGGHRGLKKGWNGQEIASHSFRTIRW